MQVTIRPLQEKDAYTSVNWRNDPDVFKYTGNTYDHIITIESELNWIRKVMSNSNDYRCAILADGCYVGNIYLTDINDESATYHIFIGEKSYWGRGVAKQASILLLDYASKVLRLSYVELSVRRNENIAAIQLYKSLNWVEEKTDGHWILMKVNL